MDRDFSILASDYLICAPGWGMRDEYALFHRVYYVCGGEVYYRQAGRTIRLQRGHLYILPTLSPYTMWHNPDDPFEVVWLHTELPEGLFSELTDAEIDPASPEHWILGAMKLLCGRPDFSHALADLFAALLDLLKQSQNDEKPRSRRMRAVETWAESRPAGELTVSGLAGAAGLERSYFSREFRETFGMSPQRYVIARRMAAAARSLSRGQTVAEAGREAGYADEKSFARAFHKFMETTPGAYRKSHMVQP